MNPTPEEESNHNPTWEKNHIAILNAIDYLTRNGEGLPSNTAIAKRTGLSVRTVSNHMLQFDVQKIAAEDLIKAKFLQSKILAKIMELAMGGDLRAAKLALQIMGLLGK